MRPFSAEGSGPADGVRAAGTRAAALEGTAEGPSDGRADQQPDRDRADHRRHPESVRPATAGIGDEGSSGEQTEAAGDEQPERRQEDHQPRQVRTHGLEATNQAGGDRAQEAAEHHTTDVLSETLGGEGEDQDDRDPGQQSHRRTLQDPDSDADRNRPERRGPPAECVHAEIGQFGCGHGDHVGGRDDAEGEQEELDQPEDQP